MGAFKRRSGKNRNVLKSSSAPRKQLPTRKSDASASRRGSRWN
jgi:hypothetical protein